jgi:hypothetical protein
MKPGFAVFGAILSTLTAAQSGDDGEYTLVTSTDDSRFDAMYLALGELKYEDPEGDDSTYVLASSEKSGGFLLNVGGLKTHKTEDTLYASIGDEGFLVFDDSFLGSDTGFKCSPDKTLTYEGQQNWFICTGDGATIYEKPAIAFSENAELQEECHRVQIQCTQSS